MVAGRITFTYTSSYEDNIECDYPDIVFEKDGVVKRFACHHVSNWTSGKPIPVRDMTYDTGVPFDITGWSYHFELSDRMRLAGNYKILEN